jgi:acyl-CoA hydrolase
MSNIHRLRGKARVSVLNALGMRRHAYDADPIYAETFECDSIFMLGPARESQRKGLTNVVPGHLHCGTGRWIEQHKPLVLISAAAPMDKDGYLYMSLCQLHEKEACESADRVIIEVNRNLPRTYGDTEIHISQIDAAVEADSELPELAPAAATELEAAIGGYVSEMVGDGDTVQFGIGGVPDAIARNLMGKRDIGVHSEMITNSMVDLVEAGVITGRRKTLYPGKIVGAFALGTSRLYEMVRENPSVMFLQGRHVNHPMVVAKNDAMISINSGFCVDLGGQVCSESIGSLQYSGTGGQADTAVGAAHARGGRNVIAVKSTANTKAGVASNICAQLPAGSVVSLSRNDVDYIVTEYGVAPMRGRSVRQRVDNLVAVAHPDFRAQLREDAKRLALW